MRISDQEYNRLQVLKAIRRAEPVSRTELVALTGLSAATITGLTRHLVARKVIAEMPVLGGLRGRPRVELALRPDAGKVLAASLDLDGLRVEAVNMRGDSLFAFERALGALGTPWGLADRISAAVVEAIDASSFRRDDFDCLAVTVPALVDNRSGVMHWLASHPPGPVPFAALIEARVGLPVVIDNFDNVRARGEHWFGEDRQLDDFTMISLGVTVGSAYYVGGMLWSGAHGMNPEFGHIKVGVNGGRPCFCGASGCLAVHAAMPAIVAEICEARGLPAPGIMDYAEPFDRFAREACAGVSDALAAFDRAGRYLGMALGNHVNATDPERVVVICMHPLLPELIAAPLTEALDRAALPPLRRQVPVVFKLDDEDEFRKGAAALGLERIYRGQIAGRR